MRIVRPPFVSRLVKINVFNIRKLLTKPEVGSSNVNSCVLRRRRQRARGAKISKSTSGVQMRAENLSCISECRTGGQGTSSAVPSYNNVL